MYLQSLYCRLSVDQARKVETRRQAIYENENQILRKISSHKIYLLNQLRQNNKMPNFICKFLVKVPHFLMDH
jgi:hypothetical protein